MVTINDIKEAREPGSSFREYREDEDDIKNRLSEDDLAWLAKRADGFKAYDIASCFVLLIGKEDVMLEPDSVEVRAYGEIDPCTTYCRILPLASDHPTYNTFVDLARKLTPTGKKLCFSPGRYLFSSDSSHQLTVWELNLDEYTIVGNETKILATVSARDVIPSDFSLVVGKGDEKKIISANKAVLCCFLPDIETLVEGDIQNVSSLDLPDLQPKPVEIFLKMYTMRESPLLHEGLSSERLDYPQEVLHPGRKD